MENKTAKLPKDDTFGVSLFIWVFSGLPRPPEGGINLGDRLFGGGGEPMNVVTEKAVDDIIDKLFK